MKTSAFYILIALSALLGTSVRAQSADASDPTYSYLFSLNLSTSYQGDLSPQVTGTISFSNASGSFEATSLTVNSFELPINNTAADDLSIPTLTFNAPGNLSSAVFTINAATGAMTAQGNVTTTAVTVGDYSYGIGLSKTSGVSLFQWLTPPVTGTGGTDFSTGGVTYTLIATPEPAAVALGATAVALFFVLRRRAQIS